MWVAKIKFSGFVTNIGSLAIKHKVDLFGFPLSFSETSRGIEVQVAGTIFGDTVNKKGFLKEFKKTERCLEIEENNDFLIGRILEPVGSKVLYEPKIYHVSPAYISSKGYEIIEIASFTKEPLMKVREFFTGKYEGELLSIVKKRINSVSVMKISPDLTFKQREAIDLAVREGYYEIPRRTDIQKLAEISGVAFSTFQVHLRKAESKLIPYSLK